MSRKHAYLLAFSVSALAVSWPALGQDAAPKKQDEAPAKKKADKRKKEEVFRVDDVLTDKCPFDKQRTGSYAKVHEFKMVPGKVYVIEMLDKNAVTMDPYLRLEDSAGVQHAEDDDSGENRNARIVFTPTKEDSYRIVATTFARATGKYQLVVQPVHAAGPAAVFGGRPGILIPVDIGDITVTPLPPWGLNPNTQSGSSDDHGYIEYPFIVENASETESHTVKITLPRPQEGFRMGHMIHALHKTVEVGPGATVQMSLFQPDLPLAMNISNAQAEVDGRVRESIPVTILSNRGGRSNMMHGRGSMGDMRSYILAPGEGVTVFLKSHVQKSAAGITMKAPPSGGYSSIGGMCNDLGPFYQKSYTYIDLHRFQAGPDSLAAWSTHWLGYTSFDGIALPGPRLAAAPPEVQNAIWQFVECGGTLLVMGSCKLPETWERTRTELECFQAYYPGFGQCLVAPKKNMEHWDPIEWRVVTGMWERPVGAWQNIRSPTDANREFPIVEGLAIPVRGLFLAMIGFVAFIGPLNVYWLSRSRRRIWLLWTVPVFSVLTCALLVGYMLVTEGWHGHVRAEGITVLDESSQRAATIGYLGFYSPTVPADGLHFSLDTELTPHLDLKSGGYDYTRHLYSIDWTSDQHFSEGWLTTKVPMHFLFRRPEKRLERLTVRKNNDGSLAVVNGLGGDIDSLWLAGLDGKLHTAVQIRAGAEAKLAPTQQQAANQPGRLNEAFRLTVPRIFQELIETPAPYLRPGCYIALIEDSAFLEQGLRQTQTRRFRSLVYGILREPV